MVQQFITIINENEKVIAFMIIVKNPESSHSLRATCVLSAHRTIILSRGTMVFDNKGNW